MAFNPQATYIGGQLLGQGLSSLGQGIGGTIQGFQDIHDRATQSRALMDYLHGQTDPTTGKPIIDDKTYQGFLQHNSRDQAFVAGGLHAGMDLAQHLQKYATENREGLARTNLYGAQAEKARADAADTSGDGSAPKGRIWSNELGGWSTPAQADAAKRRSTQGFLMQSYGVTPQQIFDSNQHEAGTVTVDPTTGAKKFTNDPAGDQIRIGGATGVIMPKAEHEIYKRQLTYQGFQAGGAAPGAGGGAMSPQQQQAVQILQKAGKPTSQANIDHVVAQLGGGGGGGAPAAAPSATPAGVPVSQTTNGGITTTRMSAPAGGAAWRQGTDAQGQPYWYTNEGDYSQTNPNG